MDHRPIGVFDSGLGGLTAVREIMEVLPGTEIVYFGDTGRVPYGTRSRETIIRYTRQNIRFLKTFHIKALLIACGTASSVALQEVAADEDFPVIGVVESAARKAVRITQNRRIGIIGTRATILSGSYDRLIRALDPQAVTFSAVCPLFVPLVENGWIEPGDEVARAIVRRYMQPLKAEGIDTLILGCTHFPLLAPFLSEELGDEVVLIDAGRETALACARSLEADDALNLTKKRGTCRFYVSDCPDDFSHVARIFLGREVEDDVERVDIDSLLK